MASNDARIAGVPITVIGFVAAPVGRIPVASPVEMISCMGLPSEGMLTGAFSVPRQKPAAERVGRHRLATSGGLLEHVPCLR